MQEPRDSWARSPQKGLSWPPEPELDPGSSRQKNSPREEEGQGRRVGRVEQKHILVGTEAFLATVLGLGPRCPGQAGEPLAGAKQESSFTLKWAGGGDPRELGRTVLGSPGAQGSRAGARQDLGRGMAARRSTALPQEDLEPGGDQPPHAQCSAPDGLRASF